MTASMERGAIHMLYCFLVRVKDLAYAYSQTTKKIKLTRFFNHKKVSFASDERSFSSIKRDKI